MTPATRHGPISRRSRSTRPFRVTTCRARSPSSAGKRSRRSPATSGLRASARDGPSMPSSWPTRWASTRPTRRGSAPWPTSPSRPRCSSWTPASMRLGGRESRGSPISVTTRAYRGSARQCPWIVTRSGRRRGCPTRSAGSRVGGRARRRRTGSRVAQQLTAGEGYDDQPDWSPDGRLVVFARYTHDAIELQLLDLAAKTVQPVTANGAVNVEPRWSPDGTRIAFVSSAYNRRWHIFTVAIASGTPAEGTVTRLTEDNDSRLPRYYYSVWDHYLSPTWSPDGRELIIVSNRGHTHGTGGFWRMTATPGAPMRELRYEETTWKARPDWSPDGSRVVYSSYLGRQWHQLWLMTSEGGDVLPLTYGEFDATAPRWSRDARHIAYISNEGGNTALWVIDVPGAHRRQIVASERRYRDPVGRLRLVVVDAAGRPLPARVSVTGVDGRAYAPDDAWRHADEAFDRQDGTNRGFEYGYFHTTGGAELTLPTGAGAGAGAVQVEVWHGPEYRVARADLTVPAGRTLTKRLVLERLANLPARGWWSGDLHVHMNYGGAYRNTPARLAFQGRAEDLHVVENLIVNKEQRIPDIAYFRTDPDPASTPGFLVVHDQEYHTSYWGHTGLLGLSDHYLLPEYVGYPNTAAASLYPMNADVADLAHAQGALFGYEIGRAH